MPPDYKVAIIDDDEGARESLRAVLEGVGISARTFDSASRYLSRAGRETPECFIVDLKMPQIDGLQFHQILVDSGVKTPVIFVTAFGDVPSAVQGMKNGAIDFIEKPYDSEVLLETVRYALNLASTPAQNLDAVFPGLSPRERQVLQHLMEGLSNKETARVLGISPRTVEIHRANLMRRTGARNLAHLLQLAMAANQNSTG